MTTIEVDILDPKADRLLRDLADMNLISIRNVPAKRKAKVKGNAKARPASKSKNEFAAYLMSWPVMTNKELKSIEEKRKHLNEWK